MLTQAQVDLLAADIKTGTSTVAAIKSLGLDPKAEMLWLTKRKDGKYVNPSLVRQLKAAKL